jgi:hypothetical protein
MLGSIITWLLPAQPPMRVIEENDPNANAIVESSPPDDQSAEMLETPRPDGTTPSDGSADAADDALLSAATEQDGSSDSHSMPVISAAQNSNTATYSTPFKPVSYLLPSADGVLSIYFAHEHPSTENYVQEHASFLWLALMHLH